MDVEIGSEGEIKLLPPNGAVRMVQSFILFENASSHTLTNTCTEIVKDASLRKEKKHNFGRIFL